MSSTFPTVFVDEERSLQSDTSKRGMLDEKEENGAIAGAKGSRLKMSVQCSLTH